MAAMMVSGTKNATIAFIGLLAHALWFISADTGW
jgi:hypothetical protein